MVRILAEHCGKESSFLPLRSVRLCCGTNNFKSRRLECKGLFLPHVYLFPRDSVQCHCHLHGGITTDRAATIWKIAVCCSRTEHFEGSHMAINRSGPEEKNVTSTLIPRDGTRNRALPTTKGPRNPFPTMCLRDNTLVPHFLVLCFPQYLLSYRPQLLLRDLT